MLAIQLLSLSVRQSVVTVNSMRARHPYFKYCRVLDLLSVRVAGGRNVQLRQGQVDQQCQGQPTPQLAGAQGIQSVGGKPSHN